MVAEDKNYITNHYTIEEWKTGKIEIVEIPNVVFQQPFENTLFELFKQGMCLNTIESMFYLIFQNEGWRVDRLPMNRKCAEHSYEIELIQRDTDINCEALYTKGVPDFLLWKTRRNDYKFIEVKFSEKNINKGQKSWFEKYKYPFYIVKLAPVKGKNSNTISNDEIIAMNRLVRGG